MKKYSIITLLLAFSTLLKAQIPYATISGNFDFLTQIDSVSVGAFKYPAFSDSDFSKPYKTKVSGQSFSIKIPVGDSPQYITLDLGRRDKMITSLLIERGDSVHLSFSRDHYLFTGRNAVKYNIIMHMKDIFNKWHAVQHGDDGQAARVYCETEDATALEELEYLYSCKYQLSKAVYQLMKDDIFADNLFKGISAWLLICGQNNQRYSQDIAYYHKSAQLESGISQLIADSSHLLYTQFFFGGIIARYKSDSCFAKQRGFDIGQCYSFLKQNYQGKIRQALVTWLIFNRRNAPYDLTPIIEDALTYVTNEDFQNILRKLQVSRLKGSPAYNFSLTDTQSRTISYESLKGKVVLIDFWYTGCPACAGTAPFIKSVEGTFKGAPVVFVSISIDAHRDTWLKSVAAGTYASPDIVNLYTDGRGENDPVLQHYNITAFPTLILIDKQGKLCEAVGDPRSDNNARLTSLINRALAE